MHGGEVLLVAGGSRMARSSGAYAVQYSYAQCAVIKSADDGQICWPESLAARLIKLEIVFSNAQSLAAMNGASRHLYVPPSMFTMYAKCEAIKAVRSRGARS